MQKRIKQTKLAQWFKKSKLGIFLIQSQGDWRYPFMVVTWKLTKFLVPRKRASVDGVSFTLSCTNWVTHFRWYLFRRKEPEVRFYIKNYVQEGDVFFDIGANVGVFSLYAGKLFKNISIYCFEPEYSNLSVLKENIVYNGLLKKTKIYSMAIGNFVGVSNLYIQDFTPGSAVHSESRKPIQKTCEGFQVIWSEGITVVTLDYISEQLGIVPNSLKVDTDGNEDKVIEGAAKMILDKRLRSIIIEIPDDNERGQYCRRMLSLAGFKLAWSERKKTRNEIWTR